MYSHISYKIPFSETDAMGIVHHSNHAKYLERGRVGLLRQIGFPYVEIMKKGIHFPVVSLSVHYHSPIRFDDSILIETYVQKISKLKIEFAYNMFITQKMEVDQLVNTNYKESKPVTTGASLHCTIDSAWKITKLDQEIGDKLKELHHKP